MAAGGVLWLALGEAFAEPGEGAVPVGGAEHVEVPIAERVRLATGGAPQRTTLRLAASTRAPVAVRRLALYTPHTLGQLSLASLRGRLIEYQLRPG